MLKCFTVFPSDGWRYGQHRQPQCPDHPPADECCALENSHSGMQVKEGNRLSAAFVLFVTVTDFVISVS